MLRYYTNPIDKLTFDDFSPLVDLALSEDCPDKDITSEAIFSVKEVATAKLVSREFGVLCGISILDVLNKKTMNQFTFQNFKTDTETFHQSDVICEIRGQLLTILRIERIFLNFVQYLSGIATQAHILSQKYPNLFILDTRKTLPGYRKLSKYAVYCGGGANHRIHLSDMAMIKDNHVAMSGSIIEAVNKIRNAFPDKKIELEIDSLSQLKEAIASHPDILLLDNFSVPDTYTATDILKKEAPNIRIECSGGITPEKLEELSKIGGIGVSMGYLTHTTRFLDLSLEISNYGVY
jgi:nicotinate-nucleotide pyrophosphorylase (carboxylating)